MSIETITAMPQIRIPGLPAADQNELTELLQVWQRKAPRNRIRSQYFNGHERVKNLAIAVPNEIAGRMNTVVGWPAKAVKALADLSTFHGLNVPDDVEAGEEAHQFARDNHLDVLLPQAIVSAYKHSCSFLTVYKGTDGVAHIRPRSALTSAAIWDMETMSLQSALTITAMSHEHGITKPTRMTLWLRGHAWDVQLTQGKWQAQLIEQTYQGVQAVPIVYDPQLDRPFGRSRISRPLMAYTDMAIRSLIRQEATAEFYSSPHLAFLGLQNGAISDNSFNSLINQIIGISKDEDGDTPSLVQIQQASMTPHSDMIKNIAMLVAAETNIPAADLGITVTNPNSAEAMAEAERKLSREADRQNRLFSNAIMQALSIAYCITHNTTQAPVSWQRIQPMWAETQEISWGARADAYAKISSVYQPYAGSTVALHKLGLTQEEIDSLHAAAREVQQQQMMSMMLDSKETTDDQSGTTAASSEQTEQAHQSEPTTVDSNLE